MITNVHDECDDGIKGKCGECKRDCPLRPQHKMYKVMWEIDLMATSPEDAARKALAVQRDVNSLATVFQVSRYITSTGLASIGAIDLSAIDDERSDEQ